MRFLHYRLKSPCNPCNPCLKFAYTLLFEALESCDVLTENIEFDIHHGSYLNVAEVGILAGIRDDGYGEGVVGWLTYSERNAVHGYAALIYGEISLTRHLFVKLLLKSEVG